MALEAQVRAKIAGKFDGELAAEATNWVYSILGQQSPAKGPLDAPSFIRIFKDGTVLCQFVNKIKAGVVKKINKPMGNFQCMENVNAFNTAIQKLGVPEESLFQSVDLCEGKNPQVAVTALQALGSALQLSRPDLPAFGPKPALENKREFTEEQLRAGDAVIGLQAGFNKGASQSGGGAFGTARHM